MAYTYYNKNPRKNIENDCVCRAISTALDLDYYDVERLLYRNSNKCNCDMLTKSCYRKLLEKDFRLKAHRGNGFTVKEIAYSHPNNNVIMRVYGHLTCSIRGEIKDIFDCSNEKVDEFWVV